MLIGGRALHFGLARRLKHVRHRQGQDVGDARHFSTRCAVVDVRCWCAASRSNKHAHVSMMHVVLRCRRGEVGGGSAVAVGFFGYTG